MSDLLATGAELGEDAPVVTATIEVPREDLKLVVNAGSWHFSYYRAIRRTWNWGEPPQHTSLCPYCQTMFWGSVAFAVFSPILILGWLELKFGSYFYKLLDKCGATRTLDLLSPGADLLDKSCHKLEKSFAFTAFTVGIFSMFVAVMLYAAVFIGWKAILFTPMIPAAIWWAATGIGWGLFQVGYGIWWAVFGTGEIIQVVGGWIGEVGGFLADFFTNGSLWTTIGTWAAMGVGSLLAFAATGFTAYKVITSDTMRGFANWALRSFSSARELAARAKADAAANAEARAAARAKIREARVAKVKKSSEPGWLRKLWGSIWSIKIDLTPLAAGADRCVVKMIGPAGILWAWLVSCKHNACPLISFVNADGTPIADPNKKDEEDEEYEGSTEVLVTENIA